MTLDPRSLLLSACMVLAGCSGMGPPRPTQKVDYGAYSEPEVIQRQPPVHAPIHQQDQGPPASPTAVQPQALPRESLPPEPVPNPALPGYSSSPYGVDPIPAAPPPEPSPEPLLADTPVLPEEPQPWGVELPSAVPAAPPPEPKTFSLAAPPAVLALESDIEGNLKSASYADAAASLERAIRIQPKNPELWHVLAEVRLKQNQPGLAEDLAKKSNLLAKNNAELIHSNWNIIAESLRLKGDAAGATEAMAKARQ
jgi:hypothetical protein